MAIEKAHKRAGAVLLTALLAPGGLAIALEKPSYQVVDKEGAMELRRYAPYVVAETVAGGEYEQAMDDAFMRLFRYISGKNRRRIDPEAPKISMTAPVTMARSGEGWRMAFMVPSRYTLESAPAPTDPLVELRARPGGLVAALTYSGRWSRERYLEREAELDAWLRARGLVPSGEAMFAGYDAPYVPWFLRRNEVLIPVAETPPAAPPAAGGTARSGGAD